MLGAVKLRLEEVPDRATRRLVTTRAPSLSDAVDPERVIEALEKSNGASPSRVAEVAEKAVKQAVVKAEAAAATATSAPEAHDDVRAMLQAIEDVRSGDRVRVERALAGESVDAALVPHVLLLLAHPELHPAAAHALVRIAPEATGQLSARRCGRSSARLARCAQRVRHEKSSRSCSARRMVSSMIVKPPFTRPRWRE